jgi:hypothetical protein
MDKFRAKKKKTAGHATCKQIAVRHIRQYKQGIRPKHRSALIMGTSCSRRAQTLGDPGTMIPILEMHLEITHGITRNIKLS